MFTAKNLSFSYLPDIPIFQNLSLDLAPRKTVALLGCSGSGKTTLFRLLTGLESLQSGELTFNQSTVSDIRSHVAYLTQHDLLLPWRTALENILLPAELTEKTPLSFHEKAKLLLEKVGLSGQGDKYPSQLSGGMRQRVSLARCLLVPRPLLFLDEPFGSLDILIREQLYRLILQLQNSFGFGTLLITHDFHEAIALADTIHVLHQGRFVLTESVLEETRQNPQKKQWLLDQLRASLQSSEELS